MEPEFTKSHEQLKELFQEYVRLYNTSQAVLEDSLALAKSSRSDQVYLFLSEIAAEQTRSYAESVSLRTAASILDDQTQKSQELLLAAVDLGYLEVSRDLIRIAINLGSLVFVRGLVSRGHGIPEEFLSDSVGHQPMFLYLAKLFYPEGHRGE